MTAIITYSESDFINNIMTEYDGNNYIIEFVGYCTFLFDKHIDNLINVHNNTIDDIIKIYYSEKELLTAKKFYKNNDYIKTLLVPKLFSKFLDAIDKQYIYDLSDAETEIYYTDDDINYNDDNYDD
jgi:hypothetical protein